jgi:tRNA-dihydrouridine synthase A
MHRPLTSPGATSTGLARPEEADDRLVRGHGPRACAPLDRRLAVAPMLDYTDRHARYLLRLLSRRTLLYSEMVTTAALLHAGPSRFLDHDPTEHPVALQLGGSDPGAMAACARLGERWGYAEINMNVGCPSDRVQSGAFGACLMAEPETVAACVRAMRDAVAVPVTVKTRIGVDHRDSYEALAELVGTVSEAGCRTFVVHARKAWLKGLSPAQNRSLPPLRYDVVYRLKRDFPRLEVVLNGGVTSLEAVREHLIRVDGVMIGRAAYENPYLLAAADRLVFGETTAIPTREQVLERYARYVEDQMAQGVQLARMTRHLLGLFHGRPGARAWRRYLTVEAARPGATPSVIDAPARLVGDSGISPVGAGRSGQGPA